MSTRPSMLRSLAGISLLALCCHAVAQNPNARLAVVPGTATTPGNNNVPLLLPSLGDAADPNAFDLSSGTDIWALVFRQPPAGCGVPTSPPIRVTPSDPAVTFQSFQFFPALPGAFLAAWVGGQHPAMPAGHSFTVFVHGVAAPGANVYELRIQVVTTMPTLTLAEVEFPRVTVRSRNHTRGIDETESEVLAIASAQGMALLAPLVNLPTTGPLPHLHHPGPMSMQFLAYFSTSETNAPVLFFGSRDPSGFFKDYRVGPRTDELMQLALTHYPADNTVVDNDYLSPWAATLGVVRDDWYAAAMEYRSWLFGQAPGSRPVWLTKANGDYLAPLAQRNPAVPAERPLPATLRNAEMFFTFDGMWPAQNFAPWASDANDQKLFYGVTTAPSVVYHGHAINMPNAGGSGTGDWHLWAPNFLAALPHTATLWGPYTLFESYDTRAASYANPGVAGFSGSADAFRRRDYGGCTLSGDGFHQELCHACANGSGQRFCGEFMKRVALDAQSRGARNVYLDVYTYEGSSMCHDPNHLHPVGGGSYMTAARRANVETMVQAARVADPEFFANSESPGEAFSDVVPLVFEHFSADALPPYGRSLPLYSAVYHDFQLVSRILNVSNNPAGTFGNAFMRRAIAYSSYFGDVPNGGSQLANVALATNLALPGFDFLRSALLLQSVVGVAKQPVVRPFFHTGHRLRDVVHTAPRLPVSYGNGLLSAWIDAASQQPTVYLSAWADPAVANKFGIMATNWTDVVDTFPPSSVVGGQQVITVTLDTQKLGVLPGNYAVELVTPAGVTPISTVSINPTLAVPVTIPPLSAIFVIFTKV